MTSLLESTYTFEKYDSYIDIIEENTTHIFGYNNVLIDYSTNNEIYIYDGLTINVNLCFFYLYNNIPLFLIDLDELSFPNFEYVINKPTLGKDDNDMFMNECKKELFFLFSIIDKSKNNDLYKGYIYKDNIKEIFAFFHIPISTGFSTHFQLSNIDKYNWLLISQIIQHTPLSFFHIFPNFIYKYKNLIFVRGSGKREPHSFFGVFYYFFIDNHSLSNADEINNQADNKRFILNIETKRFLDITKCTNMQIIFKKSLKYDSFLFIDNTLSCQNKRICVKDNMKFILFE